MIKSAALDKLSSSDRTLFTTLVKTAHEKPNLRAPILNLLREAGLIEAAADEVTKIRSAVGIHRVVKGMVVGIDAKGRTMIFRKEDYDGRGTLKGPYKVLPEDAWDILSNGHYFNSGKADEEKWWATFAGDPDGKKLKKYKREAEALLRSAKG